MPLAGTRLQSLGHFSVQREMISQAACSVESESLCIRSHDPVGLGIKVSVQNHCIHAEPLKGLLHAGSMVRSADKESWPRVF